MKTTGDLAPICAFDVTGGVATPVTESWPAPQGAGDYRWLHLDLTRGGTGDWVAAHLPEIAAGALMQAETRPRFDLEDTGLLLNLRGVNLNPGAEAEDMVSLRLWVSDGTIVSARLRRVFAVDDLREMLESGEAPQTIGGFLVRLAKGLTDRIEAVSLTLEDKVDALEDGGTDEIAPLRQKVIKLARYVGPQRAALDSLVEVETPYLDAQRRSRMREVANRATRIVEELDATRERLVALQDHRDAEAQAKLTHNNYLLAIVAAIFLPLGFLTGLFGVNVGGMPGVESSVAFAVLSVALIGIGALLALALKLWRWF